MNIKEKVFESVYSLVPNRREGVGIAGVGGKFPKT